MTKINKVRARNLYNSGGAVIAIPCKLNPNNQFFATGAVLQKIPGADHDFDKLCNQLSYYNCTNETGRYLAFYIE